MRCLLVVFILFACRIAVSSACRSAKCDDSSFPKGINVVYGIQPTYNPPFIWFHTVKDEGVMHMNEFCHILEGKHYEKSQDHTIHQMVEIPGQRFIILHQGLRTGLVFLSIHKYEGGSYAKRDLELLERGSHARLHEVRYLTNLNFRIEKSVLVFRTALKPNIACYKIKMTGETTFEAVHIECTEDVTGRRDIKDLDELSESRGNPPVENFCSGAVDDGSDVIQVFDKWRVDLVSHRTCYIFNNGSQAQSCPLHEPRCDTRLFGFMHSFKCSNTEKEVINHFTVEQTTTEASSAAAALPNLALSAVLGAFILMI